MPTTSSMAASKRHSIWGTLLFIAYLLLLFYFLFLSEGMGRAGANEYRYNVTLLKEISRYWNYLLADTSDFFRVKLFTLNVIGNIVAFVPFGFFLPMFRKKKSFWTIIWVTIFGFLFSLAVELIQLLLKVGSFDVDDMLLNTIGAFVGVCIYMIIYLIRRKK